MPRTSRTSQSALLAAAAVCLLPLLALAAQQAPPAAAPSPATASAPGAQTPPAGPRPQADPASQVQRLGLKEPANPALPSLILIGDSTVRNGNGVGADGLWGWGHPIHDFFDPHKINVVNRAIGGHSSHSYIAGGYWDLSLQLIKPGDFVLIQWGHNDGGINLPGAPPVPDAGAAPGTTPPTPPPGATPRAPNTRGSLPGIGEETLDVPDPRTGKVETVHTYGWYLRKYISDVRAKGATPILCSLVPRKIWVDGKVRRQSDTYQLWARQVAEQQHVGFVDLNEIIGRRYDALGPDAVDKLFGDPHTHTNYAGSILNAESVVSGLRALPEAPLDKYLNGTGKAVAPYNPKP